MKLRKQLKSLLLKSDDPHTESQARMRFTGEPPVNPSECLIQEIVGENRSVQIGWLREQVCDNLYRVELRQGGWAADIGLWGPTAFTGEADRLMAKVRPQFACLVQDIETDHQTVRGC